MILIENAEVSGWEAAVRGMRNPMNSWEKSDSKFGCISGRDETNCAGDCHPCCSNYGYLIGENDMKLMKGLRASGPDHRKFMRFITVTMDVTAPLYWWKEADTYKVGTVANSCSTMHKIHAKKLTLDDFSHEHLIFAWRDLLKAAIDALEYTREVYTMYDTMSEEKRKAIGPGITCKKDLWWQIIQLLPSSYNQQRTLMLNYEVLTNIYHARKAHKLEEWKTFCAWIETLPYAKELIYNVGTD